MRALATRNKHSCHLERSETESKDLQLFFGRRAFAEESPCLEDPSIRDHRRGVPPGQNKYFCGNLQIITHFCEASTERSPCLQAG